MSNTRRAHVQWDLASTLASPVSSLEVHGTTGRWPTREELCLAIVVWIEKTYHRRRRQDGLGRLTPIEFETLLQPLMRPDPNHPNESTKVWAVPFSPRLPLTTCGQGRAI